MKDAKTDEQKKQTKQQNHNNYCESVTTMDVVEVKFAGYC
jgi:hypothetical protein